VKYTPSAPNIQISQQTAGVSFLHSQEARKQIITILDVIHTHLSKPQTSAISSSSSSSSLSSSLSTLSTN
jgi:hypothetical protein